MSDRPKGRLAFVGLGLHDEKDITVRGMEEISGADVVFSESYTSRLSEGAISRLSESTGKEVRMLSRKEVEDASAILDSCMGRRVAFLVVGDPLTATTHVDLRLRAHRLFVETVVVHAPSAITAVPGILGLQHYKFGRVATLPYPQEGYLPTSPCEMILENLGRGLHSLVLLDIDSENDRYMTANEGMRLLLEMSSKLGERETRISEDTMVCVVARAGSTDCVASAGKLEDMRLRNFGPPLHTIVIPGRLHFMEEEALSAFAGAEAPRG
jgi:diphthine synthase